MVFTSQMKLICQQQCSGRKPWDRLQKDQRPQVSGIIKCAGLLHDNWQTKRTEKHGLLYK